LSPSEFFERDQPILTHLERREGEAQYAIAIPQSSRNVAVLLGGYATIRIVSEDDFRQMWSGVCVAAEQEGRSLIQQTLAVVLCAASLVVATEVLKNVRRKGNLINATS